MAEGLFSGVDMWRLLLSRKKPQPNIGVIVSRETPCAVHKVTRR